MNKENNRSAAGRRPSAIQARKNLQAEWSALKGSETNPMPLLPLNQLKKQQRNQIAYKRKHASPSKKKLFKLTSSKESTRNMHRTSDVLRGVVALVETGSEPRALPLRAALAALGATVLPAWNPLVTHLVWSPDGSRATRAKARALASRVVSPLWVQACAAAAARLPEAGFPAVARPSDLPSPAALRVMLKKVEMENIDITNLLSESDDGQKLPRLRISTDTENDTTNDTSRDTTNTSRDTSKDISRDSTDIESRVNTAPRRALPKLSETLSPIKPTKCRRQLFTHKETDKMDEDSDETTLPKPVVVKPLLPQTKKMTTKQQTTIKQPSQYSRKDLAKAERLARKILAGTTQTDLNSTRARTEATPRIVLTGMSRTERQSAFDIIKRLNGRVQKTVDKKTTHVVLGPCVSQDDNALTGATNIISPTQSAKVRTYNALAGAARGCRVLSHAWVWASGESGRWAHTAPYHVPHLKKISQRARVERVALCLQRAEYAYDLFYGMRVRVCDAVQCDSAKRLLALCGAAVYDDTENCVQNSGQRQNATAIDRKIVRFNGQEYDVKIGAAVGDIGAKWVFDSVASARMRTARRYVVLENCQMATQLEKMKC